MRDRLTLAVMHSLAKLPLRVNHALGATLGFCAWLFPNRLRRVTDRNLALCLPDKDARWRRRTAQRSLVEAGKSLTETALLWGAHSIDSWITEINGREIVDAARAQGRGVIFVTPHLGCWEICGLYVARFGPLYSLYQPPKAGAAFNEAVRRGRQTTGAVLVPTTAGGIKRLLQALDRGENVGILPDQEPSRPKGVFAPFFGVPAYTMRLLGRLARRRGSPVVYVYAQRLPRAAGYRIHFRAAPFGIDAPDEEASAAAVNTGIECMVRECPEQYAWSYKRFGKRPRGEPRVYRR